MDGKNPKGQVKTGQFFRACYGRDSGIWGGFNHVDPHFKIINSNALSRLFPSSEIILNSRVDKEWPLLRGSIPNNTTKYSMLERLTQP